ncbi:Hexuronate transporter [Klebsiella pneumoniae IS46]|nr:Hexuronate transporter [Klebsiella pneumoniae IS46]
MWLAIAINYIDRTVLSAAAPHLIDELKLDPEMMGFIMAAFFFGHTRYYRSPPGGSPIVLVRKKVLV